MRIGKEISREKEKEDSENIFLALRKSNTLSKELFEQNHIVYHELVALDIENDNITLLIDPTYIGIGIYKQGKIIMFNEQKEGIYERRLREEGIIKGIEGIIEYPIDYAKSFREPKLSMEELERKYGLDAQNEMLKQIDRKDNKKTLREELKIHNEVTYNFEKNTVTINKKREDESQEQEL